MHGQPTDDGKTLGARGPQAGIILLDAELDGEARLVMESGGETAPFSITSMIYGELLHATFAGTRQEADDLWVELRTALEAIVNETYADAKERKFAQFNQRF